MLRSIGNWIAFVIALVLVILTIFYFDGVRNVMSQVNERIEDYVFSSSSWVFATTMRPILRVVLTLLEGFILTMIVAAIIRTAVAGREFRQRLTFGALRHLVMFVAVVASVVFGLYAFSILWGDVKPLGIVIRPAFDPPRVTIGLVGTLGMVGAWYAVSQGIPLLFPPRLGVAWPIFQAVSSGGAFGVILTALASYWFGEYLWSTYRLWALKLWAPVEIFDVIVFAVNIRFLTRGFYSGAAEEAIIQQGGPPVHAR